MINENEIRIGNWVKWHKEKEPNEARWSLGHWAGIYAKNYSFNDCEGIPLTPEWLERFGFEKINESPFKNYKMPYWVKNGIVLFFNESPPDNTYFACIADFVSDFNGGGEYIAIGRRWIDQVHLVQNFYHSNIEEELKLK